jgi:thymidylate kinase
MKIVAFEGSDYSGKTTTSKLLAKESPNMIYNSGSIFSGEELELMKALGNINELQREALYTSTFFLDKHRMIDDNRIILQDRYWMSVVAYGRFLNGVNSIHHKVDLSRWMIKPDAVIYLSCTLDEKIRRSNIRGVKSVLDKYLLQDPSKIKLLESEIEHTLTPFNNVLRIDTTFKSENEVVNIVKNYLVKIL